jgi:ABC-type glycerol-3-phosphate transport system substrate-binding protein
MGPHGTESRTFLSGWSYGVPVGARAPEAARQFIRFMSDPQVQKERALRSGPLPTIERIYTDPEVLAFNPDYPKIRQMLRTARWRSEIPNYANVSKVIQRRLFSMLKAETSPEECLEALRTGVAEVANQ